MASDARTRPIIRPEVVLPRLEEVRRRRAREQLEAAQLQAQHAAQADANQNAMDIDHRAPADDLRIKPEPEEDVKISVPEEHPRGSEPESEQALRTAVEELRNVRLYAIENVPHA